MKTNEYLKNFHVLKNRTQKRKDNTKCYYNDFQPFYNYSILLLILFLQHMSAMNDLFSMKACFHYLIKYFILNLRM